MYNTQKTVRSLSLAVILAALTLLIPVISGRETQVYAAASDFEITNGVVENYNGKGGNITVPSTATAIGDQAFSGCGNITGITVPSSVKTIGQKAFYNCAALETVSLPTAVRTIGEQAFDRCPKLAGINVTGGGSYFSSVGGVLFNAAQSTLIRYPEGISSSSYTVPSSVKTIGKGAFFRCTSLKKLTLPAGVTSIEDKAFYEASGLTSFTVPSTVKSIGSSAFYSAQSLKTLSFEAKSPSVAGSAFQNAPVARILYAGSQTEWGSTAMSDIFSSSVMVYYNMSGFNVDDNVLISYTGSSESLSVPGFIVRIDNRAFLNCTILKTVTLPNSLKTIGQSAFDGCSSLTRLTIPSSVVSIEKWAFDRCPSLQKISVVSDNQNYSASSGVLFDKNKTQLIRYPQAAGNESYTVPSSVTAIGDSAFALCGDLKSVVLPSELETIDKYAFDQCSGLTEITIPASVTSVGANAFRNDGNLAKVTINAISPKIDASAFSNAGVKTVIYAGTTAQWSSAGLSAAFDSSVKVICDTADFVVEGSVLKKYTGSAQSVVIPDYITAIGDSAFSHCTTVTSITIPSGVTSIGESAFAYCGALTKITIPASVTSIGKWAFDSCHKMTAINVNASNQKFCSVDGVLYTKNKASILRYPCGKAGSSYKIDANTRTIGDSAFATCGKLTEMSVTSGVTTIENYAFDQCSTLTKITLPSSVTSVAKYAFRYCTKLRTAVIYAVSPSVDMNAFYGDSLTAVCYASGQSQWTAAKLGSVFGGEPTVYCNYALPTVTKSPESRTVARGDTITLSVTAKGSGLSYQWYFRKAGVTEWSVWNGHTSASENVRPNDTWDGIQLYCKVKDAAGATVNSSIAKITLRDAITVTVQPKSISSEKGSAITLAVQATGTNLTYQWYFKKAGQTAFTLWSGRTHASETVTPNDTWNGIQLYCLIRDSEGHSLKSQTATVTLREPLRIVTQPQSCTIVKGSAVRLTVKATGTGLKYQWYFKKAGQTSWTLWSGRTGTSETVTPNDTWDGIQLFCRVTDVSGAYVNSAAAMIKFGTPLKITSQPTSRTFTLGSSITLPLKAQGTGLKYQWYFKKAGQTSFTKWNGHTAASENVTPNATWNGIRLYCLITDGAGASVRSDTITVTMK